MPGRGALAHQALDHFLRYAADDALVPGMKRHPGPDHGRRRGAAEKTVALDEQRLRAVARCRKRGGATRIAAADDEHVHAPRFVAARSRPFPRAQQ